MPVVVLEDIHTAFSVQFVVQLDDVNLGAFTSCEGLGVEVVLETREEGGNNNFVWQLPTRLKYPNIKLSRPLGKDTTKIADWFASMSTGYKRCTATIQAMSVSGEAVAHWGLLDVVPVRWTGPQFNSDSPKMLTETIEIAHHGFVPSGGS